MGRLARTLSRMAPEMEALVAKLNTELTRREAILTSMIEGVLAVDAQLNVTFCNQAFMHAVGDRAAAEGISLVRVVRDPGLLRVLKQVIESGEALRRRLRLAEGRAFDVYAAPMSSNGRQGALAILHDVTPITNLERVKRDFVANVSHELRTPLATIRGYTETLLEGALEDPQNRRKFVEIIQATSIRLNNIASDLLTLSQIEDGRPRVAPGPISLPEAVAQSLSAVEPTASLHQVAIRTAPVPDVVILGYGFLLQQALTNLLDNAVKFNRVNGTVTVEVTAGGEHVQIAVADTGSGIPERDLERVFERFYRVDKARSRSVGGTGLGLSIVKHAIEQMNGIVSVESELEKGSRFTIRLPLYPAPAS